MLEIERKYLVVNDDYKLEATGILHIFQGYLSKDKERTVRIRIVNGQGFLTIKGKTNKTGTTRFEWEKKIDLEDAQKLMDLALPGIIEKIRYIIPVENNLKFEVDEFLGEHEGFVLAEIELPDENTNFKKPGWLGKEVTGNPDFYNSNM